MDVRMPDGTLIRDVPEGTTKAALQAKLARLDGGPSPTPQAAPDRPATGAGDRFLAGLADPIYGAAQIADKAIDPVRQFLFPGASNMADVVRERDKDYQAPEGFDWARMGGNVANPISWAGGGAGAGWRGAAMAARAGAGQAALTPVDPDADFATEKAKQMALGGVAGGALHVALPRALGGLVKPTDEAAALQRAGVTLTPGQAAGGWLNTKEQQLTSIPVVGDIIGHGRGRALRDFQDRVIERATSAKRGEGAKTIQEANEAVSGMYQDVVPKLRPTEEASIDVLGAVARAHDNPELTEANRKILEGIHDKLFGRDGERYAKLSGDALKDLDTELGAITRRYQKSVLPSDHVLAEELHNVQQAMRNAWKYHLDPADAAKLDDANRAYRRMIPVNKAGSARADEVVTPRALQKALARQAGRDVTRMPADELVSPANKVLGSTVPDSGTAGRLAIPAAIAAVMTAPAAAIGGGLAAAGAYTRTGANLLTGNTALQRELKKMSPAARKALIASLRAQQAGQGQGQPEAVQTDW